MFIRFAWYRINAFNLQIYTVFSSARFSSILFLNAFSFLLAVFCISSHPLPLLDCQYLVSKDVAFSLITSNFPCPFLLHPEKASQTHSPCHGISCPQALSRLLLSPMSFKSLLWCHLCPQMVCSTSSFILITVCCHSLSISWFLESIFSF